VAEAAGVIMANLDVWYSSKTDNWTTPQDFFEELNQEFDFNLDPCASDENHKCERYFTKENNGLSQNWGGCRVFCNPPYGRETGKWIKKCYEEGHKENTIVVALIPARTDTKYFHDYILYRSEIRFVKGRLYFGNGVGRAPFPSMVVIFRGPGM
jgi:site-specific DNA-methyltransferase (adenine-specific)